MKRTHRCLSLLLAAVMVCSLLSGLSLPASAADDVLVLWWSNNVAEINLSNAGQSYSLGGITLTTVPGKGTVSNREFTGHATDNSFIFSCESGYVITEIVIYGTVDFVSSGWTNNGSSASWTGEAAEVPMTCHITDVGSFNFRIRRTGASVSYINAGGTQQTANGVKEVTSGTTTFSAGWYAVTSDVTDRKSVV